MQTRDNGGPEGHELKRAWAGEARTAAVLRRTFLSGAGAVILSGCTGVAKAVNDQADPSPNVGDRSGIAGIDPPEILYASMMDGEHKLPAINHRLIRPEFHRSVVAFPTDEEPGTVVVRLDEYYLYLIQKGGKAIRYGVGVGRDGFSWTGTGSINQQKSWPDWTPPIEMIARLPELAAHRDGMPGGLANPLGARALYIFRGGIDTLYRIHGTPEWWTIGRAMSSGCIRMINQDAVDLAGRVAVGSRIVVT